MTARRVFTAKEIREAVALVQESHVGIRFWPDGSMEIMPPRLDTVTPVEPPSSLTEWRRRRDGMETAQRDTHDRKAARGRDD